jgi:hypothetical protein
MPECPEENHKRLHAQYAGARAHDFAVTIVKSNKPLGAGVATRRGPVPARLETSADTPAARIAQMYE